MLESSIFFVCLLWNGRSPRKPRKKEEEERDLSLMDPVKIHLCSISKYPCTSSQFSIVVYSFFHHILTAEFVGENAMSCSKAWEPSVKVVSLISVGVVSSSVGGASVM